MSKLRLKFIATQRGFLAARFKDLYGNECSIQKSSLATDDAIWFGCDEATHYRGTVPFDASKEGIDCAARMHLNREQVAALIPALQHFVDTGKLPRE